MAKKVEEPKEVVRLVDYSKDIDGAILAVKKDGVKLKHKIHNVALSIVTAWGKKQVDGQKAADYFTGLGLAAGYHGKALADWISVKLPLKFAEETNKWYCPPDVTVNGDDFKACRDEPFWEVSPPKKPSPFNALALLEALIQKNTTKAAHPDKLKADDKLLPADVAQGIRELIAKAKAEMPVEH